MAFFFHLISSSDKSVHPFEKWRERHVKRETESAAHGKSRGTDGCLFKILLYFFNHVRRHSSTFPNSLCLNCWLVKWRGILKQVQLNSSPECKRILFFFFLQSNSHCFNVKPPREKPLQPRRLWCPFSSMRHKAVLCIHSTTKGFFLFVWTAQKNLWILILSHFFSAARTVDSFATIAYIS